MESALVLGRVKLVLRLQFVAEIYQRVKSFQGALLVQRAELELAKGVSNFPVEDIFSFIFHILRFCQI